jgi:hypothetical protein
MFCAALPAALIGQKENIIRSSYRAGDAIRPALPHQVVQAVVLIGEVNYGLLKGGRLKGWMEGFHN